MASMITVGSGYTRISNMFGGNDISSTTLTPNAGNTTTWKADVTYYLNSGDVCASGTGSGCRSYAKDAGRDHWQINKIGTTSGHYLSTQITGFKFKVSQNSGAGHGLYVRRYGFLLRQKNGSSSYFWSTDAISRGSYGTKSYSHTFDSTVLNSYLRNGWCFDEFRYQVSTYGGSGTRTSEVIVYDFQFNYVGQSGKLLIVPVKRSYSDRAKYQIA